MDYEGKQEYFILEEYDIGSDAEIQLELLRNAKTSEAQK